MSSTWTTMLFTRYTSKSNSIQKHNEYIQYILLIILTLTFNIFSYSSTSALRSVSYLVVLDKQVRMQLNRKPVDPIDSIETQ